LNLFKIPIDIQAQLTTAVTQEFDLQSDSTAELIAELMGYDGEYWDDRVSQQPDPFSQQYLPPINPAISNSLSNLTLQSSAQFESSSIESGKLDADTLAFVIDVNPSQTDCTS
jgi:hypothetical protein